MGENKYNNFKKYLENNNYFLTSSLEDFKKSEKIIYRCDKYQHETEITITAFGNKKAKYKNNPVLLCSGCNIKGEFIGDRFDRIKQDMYEKTGHILLKLENRNITYECGNCGLERTSDLSNLNKSNVTKYCSTCLNQKTKTPIDDLQKKLDNLDLSFSIVDYQNNKDVKLLCEKGHEFKAVVNDIVNRGRGCPQCAPEKRKETNLKKYGVEHVFQSEEIKEKIKETSLKKYGTEHYLQNDEMKERLRKTMLYNYGIEYSFHSDKCFEKIRNTCLEKYGCKFPLQSPVIQAKITQTFLLTIGVERPMMDQEWWTRKIMEKYSVPYYILSDESKKNCLEKYGHEYHIASEPMREMSKDTCLEKYGSEYYINSDQSKAECLEKYGSEYYINSDQSKAVSKSTCLKKYGVEYYFKSDSYKEYCLKKFGTEHPMQNSDIYYKTMINSFKRKEFIFPSGRKEYILGYEDSCIKNLLTKHNENDIIVDPRIIPTFQYTKLRKDGTEFTGKYFPDVFISETNNIYFIEVKSTWTWNMDEENNKRKIDTVINNGYDIELWIYENMRKLIKCERYNKIV